MKTFDYNELRQVQIRTLFRGGKRVVNYYKLVTKPYFLLFWEKCLKLLDGFERIKFIVNGFSLN